MKFLAILALSLSSSLVTIGPANAESWSAPTTLGQSSLYYMYANNVSVAVSPNPLAESVAVWAEPSTMAIKYAIKQNGVWSGAKILYTANANASEQVTDPQVVIDASGTVTAIWGSTKQGAVTYCVSGNRVVRCIPMISFAKAATLASGATAWTKTNLSSQGWAVTDAQIGLDLAGNAVALWKFKATSAAVPSLQSATRPAAGVWSAPNSVYASSVSLPQLAVGTNGAAVATWLEQTAATPPSYAIKASFKPAGGAWGGAEAVATQSSAFGHLRVTVDGNDRVALVTNHNYGVQLARRTAAGWSAPENLVSGPDRIYGYGLYMASGPDIASSGSGDELITWLETNPDPSTPTPITVEATVISSDGGSSHASWPVGTTVPPRAAMSPDGSLATIAWADDSDYNAYAVSATPDQTSGWNLLQWGQPLLLSSGNAQYSAAWGMGVSLAAGPNLSATAVWLSAGGANYQIKLTGSSYQP